MIDSRSRVNRMQAAFTFRGPVPRHRLGIFIAIFAAVIGAGLAADLSGQDRDDRAAEQKLPTSKRLAAAIPGRPRRVNSFPANLVLSPDGKYAVALNGGYGTAESWFKQSLAVLDLASKTIADFPDERLDLDAHQSYFLGLAFSSDGRHVYASVGSLTDPAATEKASLGNGIIVYSFDSGKIAPEKFFKLPLETVAEQKVAAPLNKKLKPNEVIPYPAGIGVVKRAGGDQLLVAANLSDEAILLDAASGRILHRFDLSTERVVPGSYPYGVAVTRDGSRAYVSLWNSSRVADIDLVHNTLARMIPLHRPVSHTASGSHPTALLLNADDSRLYVALANSDDVAVIDTKSGGVKAYLSARLPGQKLLGVEPVALALNSAGTRLYVADSGANAIAVLDASENQSGAARSGRIPAKLPPREPLGFFPTEWYPQALAIHGDELIIACGKGRGTAPTNHVLHPDGSGNNGKYDYIFELLHGSLATVNVKEIERNLPETTKTVAATNFGTGADQRLPFPEGKSLIHHVIYIIKENRTYDQIFGDLKGANGDPSLTMYGEDITPNQHQLAREFGILDNFYDSGEVSGDGHNWSTAAIASDYLEKAIQPGYRNNEERTYDYEGENANLIPLENDMPDVNETGTGYIWTDVAQHRLSYRHYGEFVTTKWCNELEKTASPRQGMPSPAGHSCPKAAIQKGEPLPANFGQPHGSPSPWPWPVPLIARNIATKPELRNHFDPRFPDFETQFPDQLRVDEFLNEFEGFVRARKEGTGATLPNYVMLRIPNDHTSGTHPNYATPAAAVADNDLAVGRIVEAVSNSPYWQDTAILILEDDAQDGPDHVDAHRSTALLISAYSPASTAKPFVESGFYTTVSMVRTLEALLGLPPMNHNDAEAPVIASLFSGDGHHASFRANYRNRDNGLIYQMNSPNAPGAKESEMMDFSHADQADAAKLNEILWRDRMGERPMPPPQHNVFPADADDDDRPASKDR